MLLSLIGHFWFNKSKRSKSNTLFFTTDIIVVMSEHKVG